MTKELLNQMESDRVAAWGEFVRLDTDAAWLSYETIRDDCKAARIELAERKENGQKLLDLCKQAQDAADAGNIAEYEELLERIQWVRKHLLL